MGGAPVYCLGAYQGCITLCHEQRKRRYYMRGRGKRHRKALHGGFITGTPKELERSKSTLYEVQVGGQVLTFMFIYIYWCIGAPYDLVRQLLLPLSVRYASIPGVLSNRFAAVVTTTFGDCLASQLWLSVVTLIFFSWPLFLFNPRFGYSYGFFVVCLGSNESRRTGVPNFGLKIQCSGACKQIHWQQKLHSQRVTLGMVRVSGSVYSPILRLMPSPCKYLACSTQ